MDNAFEEVLAGFLGTITEGLIALGPRERQMFLVGFNRARRELAADPSKSAASKQALDFLAESLLESVPLFDSPDQSP